MLICKPVIFSTPQWGEQLYKHFYGAIIDSVHVPLNGHMTQPDRK